MQPEGICISQYGVMYICPNRQQPGHTGAQGQGTSALPMRNEMHQRGNQGEVYFTFRKKYFSASCSAGL